MLKPAALAASKSILALGFATFGFDVAFGIVGALDLTGAFGFSTAVAFFIVK
jgi:hypothetical protein